MIPTILDQKNKEIVMQHRFASILILGSILLLPAACSRHVIPMQNPKSMPAVTNMDNNGALTESEQQFFEAKGLEAMCKIKSVGLLPSEKILVSSSLRGLIPKKACWADVVEITEDASAYPIICNVKAERIGSQHIRVDIDIADHEHEGHIMELVFYFNGKKILSLKI